MIKRSRLEHGKTRGRVNRVLDIRGEYRPVLVHELFTAVMTCRYQLDTQELKQLRHMAEGELRNG